MLAPLPQYALGPSAARILGRMQRAALITGITGQDGSYLAELLLEKGYRVVGMTRRSSTVSNERIAHIADRIELVQGDLLDQASLVEAIHSSQPDEVYNLAAQSFVPTSWNQPVLTGEFTALGVTRMLEAIRQVNPGSASTRPPRARCSARFARLPRPSRHRSTRAARTAWPRRTATTSPSTIARATACLRSRGSCSITSRPGAAWSSSPARSPTASPGSHSDWPGRLRMGNLDAHRDWGFAGDYVRAMWLMLQTDRAIRLRHRHRSSPLGTRVV